MLVTTRFQLCPTLGGPVSFPPGCAGHGRPAVASLVACAPSVLRTRVAGTFASVAGPTDTSYNVAHLRVLEGLEAVRKRPGMYIGSTDTKGLMHCLWEVIDNGV